MGEPQDLLVALKNPTEMDAYLETRFGGEVICDINALMESVRFAQGARLPIGEQELVDRLYEMTSMEGYSDCQRLARAMLKNFDVVPKVALPPPPTSAPAQCKQERRLDLFAWVHPHSGIWNPSIRTTEDGARATFVNRELHEVAGWKICPVQVTYSVPSTDEKSGAA